VSDVIARWLNMYGSRGVGLRGGSFTTTGALRTRWRLHDVRWVSDVSVSGTARWDRTTGRVRARVTVRGKGAVPVDSDYGGTVRSGRRGPLPGGVWAKNPCGSGSLLPEALEP
jgi:hypothetical protein